MFTDLHDLVWLGITATPVRIHQWGMTSKFKGIEKHTSAPSSSDSSKESIP
jgi:hypothetical protein